MIIKISLAIVLLLIVGCFFFIIRTRKKYKIANTPAIVISIKKIAEFVTVSFFEEKIMIDRKPQKIVDHKLGRFLADKLHKENGLRCGHKGRTIL
jgi:branched-subunit amino acid permease